MGLSNGLKSITEPVTYVIRNHLLVSEQEFNSRLGHCEQCNEYRADSAKCQLCGCYMRWKAQLQLARCPLGKW